MLKKILAVLALLYAAASFAAVDVNKATATELDAVKGIGPAMSKRILDERKKGDFKSWDDLISRVKGVGGKTAARYSGEGLTVNGQAYKNASAASGQDGMKDAKAGNQPEAKDAKALAKPAQAAAKKDDKAVAGKK